MSGRDWVEGLREAEAARQAQELSPAAERRIRSAIERRRPLRAWAWGMGLGTALAAGLAALIAYTAGGPQKAHVPVTVNGFAVADGTGAMPQTREDGTVIAQHGPITLFDREGRIEVAASQGAVVRREAQGLRVVAGSATLHVLPRQPGEPSAKVLVSSGAIEVLGTRFTVVQDEVGGTVTLHEGKIRFRQDDGREVTLAPGQSLSWPLPQEQAARTEPAPPPEGAHPQETPSGGIAAVERPPPPRKAQPRSQVEQPPAFDVEAFIDELSVLRRKGRFADAALRLEGALSEPLPSSTRERLSYEYGSILTWQLKDTGRACEVWARHQAAWPNGRYASEVGRARASLGCP